jgi:long-chain acyl-CoA synthetase
MLTTDEIKHIVNDCNAKAIITSSDKASAMINLKKESSVNVLISFGNAPLGAESFNEMIGTKSDTIKMPNILPETLSTIGYTSGTTGHPKGAMQSHKAVIINGAMTSQFHMRGPDDIVFQCFTMSLRLCKYFNDWNDDVWNESCFTQNILSFESF